MATKTRQNSISCPKCGYHTSVRRTKAHNSGLVRYRICDSCGHKFATREIPIGKAAETERAISGTLLQVAITEFASTLGITIDTSGSNRP